MARLLLLLLRRYRRRRCGLLLLLLASVSIFRFDFERIETRRLELIVIEIKKFKVERIRPVADVEQIVQIVQIGVGFLFALHRIAGHVRRMVRPWRCDRNTLVGARVIVAMRRRTVARLRCARSGRVRLAIVSHRHSHIRADLLRLRIGRWRREFQLLHDFHRKLQIFSVASVRYFVRWLVSVDIAIGTVRQSLQHFLLLLLLLERIKWNTKLDYKYAESWASDFNRFGEEYEQRYTGGYLRALRSGDCWEVLCLAGACPFSSQPFSLCSRENVFGALTSQWFAAGTHRWTSHWIGVRNRCGADDTRSCDAPIDRRHYFWASCPAADESLSGAAAAVADVAALALISTYCFRVILIPHFTISSGIPYFGRLRCNEKTHRMMLRIAWTKSQSPRRWHRDLRKWRS